MRKPKLSKLELQILEALWAHRKGIHSRDPGSLPGASPRLHHHPDHRLPPGREEGRATRAENQQRPHL